MALLVVSTKRVEGLELGWLGLLERDARPSDGRWKPKGAFGPVQPLTHPRAPVRPLFRVIVHRPDYQAGRLPAGRTPPAPHHNRTAPPAQRP